ncbi:Leucine-rich repeat and calponin homology domain-containing protein 4 [Larimichthys crocea]|uniref:Uncharacterized protein n=1 Tax=Larimichthys crocea TaxID=215358 RepID=A0ACD3Q4N0_LARCR|nr:Leucine-rich repeat and calponin homology domain-containing protein 4 [Larimichthys crocea]
MLPLLRVLIVSNNKLCSLPASIFSLTHLRQLDVSCNELQCLPAELGQLECLRDLNLRRNQLTTLPEEISELPLVRLDVSCNRISHVPLCYRHLRHLQSIQLDNNPLQMPPAQICSKGKYHIFKYLNMEACKRSQEELERHLRPTGFNSCLSDQELFTVNGEAEHVDFIDSSVTEEEEEEIKTDPPTPPFTAPPLEQKENSSPPQSQDSAVHRSSLHVEVCPPSSSSSSPLSPSSPSLEERKRPGTLFIWQERERLQQQQREKANGGSPENSNSHSGLRQRCASAEQMSSVSPSTHLHRSSSRTDVPSSPKTSPPPGQAQKPNSFLFRTSSRSNVKPTGTIFTLGESGRSESRTMLRSPKEERPDITQLRKTLESRLKITLPEDLGEALSNGTVLCQLVNHIRPRSVSIIHIPSPAVPKLSSAKCRLNVENFIAACRKLGVPEDSLCSPQLITEDEGLCRLAQTVQVLVDLADGSQRALKQETSGTSGSTQC